MKSSMKNRQFKPGNEMKQPPWKANNSNPNHFYRFNYLDRDDNQIKQYKNDSLSFLSTIKIIWIIFIDIIYLSKGRAFNEESSFGKVFKVFFVLKEFINLNQSKYF